MIQNIGAWDPALLTAREPEATREPGAPLMIHRLVEIAGRRHNVTPAALYSRSRVQHVAFVRQVAMHLLRECAHLSFPAIGRMFGRDHSTVIHACNMIGRRIREKSDFAARIEGLRNECR